MARLMRDGIGLQYCPRSAIRVWGRCWWRTRTRPRGLGAAPVRLSLAGVRCPAPAVHDRERPGFRWVLPSASPEVAGCSVSPITRSGVTDRPKSGWRWPSPQHAAPSVCPPSCGRPGRVPRSGKSGVRASRARERQAVVPRDTAVQIELRAHRTINRPTSVPGTSPAQRSARFMPVVPLRHRELV